MKQYLIINESHSLIPYKEKYLLFNDRQKGIDKLFELGWEKGGFFGMEPSDEIGMLSMQACGDKKLSWIPIETSD